MNNWLDGVIKVDGVRLHYVRTGGDKPPVVCAHGIAGNAQMWARTVQALTGDYEVVMYDTRGHGWSDRLVGEFGEEERLTDLLGVIEGLHLQHPGLIGHSMGGATITHAAARQPDLARFLILEDPGWHAPVLAHSAEEEKQVEQMQKTWREGFRQLVLEIQNAMPAAALVRARQLNPLWAEYDINLWLDTFRQFDVNIFDHMTPSQLSWRELLPKLRCPFLLITAEQSQGGIISPEQADEAIGLNPGGRYVKIPGAGHSIKYDQFEAYIEAVKGFLQELERKEWQRTNGL